MFRQILCVAVTLAAVQAAGELTILHSPESVTFRGEEELSQTVMTEVFTAALGNTPKLRSSWDGMAINDIFDLPEAVVVVAVEGVKSIESPSGKHYPLIEDESEETTWQALSGRLEERDKSKTLIRINLEDGVDALGQSVLGELKVTPIDESSLKSLSVKNKWDREFLEQTQLLDALTKKVSQEITVDDKADLYWFVVSALPAVIDAHRDQPAAVKEAFAILNNALSRLSSAFMDAYKGKVIIAAFTNDASHARHTRAAGDEVTRSIDNITVADVNPSKEYDETYPVMFTIFLWFGVAFVFSLIAICITIADMDPGRDSIIYRMTSNRMKKDN